MKVIKRDGHMVDYCPDKIEEAIEKANQEVEEEDNFNAKMELNIKAHRFKEEKEMLLNELKGE